VHSWQDMVLCAIHEDVDNGTTPDDMEVFAHQLQWITGIDLTEEEAQDRALVAYYVNRTVLHVVMIHNVKVDIGNALSAWFPDGHVPGSLLGDGELVYVPGTQPGDVGVFTLEGVENQPEPHAMGYEAFVNAKFAGRHYLFYDGKWSLEEAG